MLREILTQVQDYPGQGMTQLCNRCLDLSKSQSLCGTLLQVVLGWQWDLMFRYENMVWSQNRSLEWDLASACVLHLLHFLVPIIQRWLEMGQVDHGWRSKGYKDLGGGHEVP